MTKGVRVWPGHSGQRVKGLEDKVKKRPLDVQEEENTHVCIGRTVRGLGTHIMQLPHFRFKASSPQRGGASGA